MLYLVFVGETFADLEDRCGVVEAESLQAAGDRVAAWSRQLAKDMSCKPIGPSLVTVEVAPDGIGDVAVVTTNSRDDCPEGGFKGKDVYYVRPVRGDKSMLMFAAQDWNLVFV